MFGSYTHPCICFFKFSRNPKRRRPWERSEPHVDKIQYSQSSLSISSKFYDCGSVDGNLIRGIRNGSFISNFMFPIMVVFV